MGTSVKANPNPATKPQASSPAPASSGSDLTLSGVLNGGASTPTPAPAPGGDSASISPQAQAALDAANGQAAGPTASGAPVSTGDTAASAAMYNYLMQKSGNASEPLLGGDFLDGTAEAVVPFYLHAEKNKIRQEYANVAMQVAMQTIDPADPQAKQKIDALYAYEMKQADQKIHDLPLPSAGRAVTGAVVDGAEVAKSGTFHAAGGTFGFLGGFINSIGGFFSGIGHWFNSNA